MPGATVADVWKVYVKPSMKGRLVIRKKTVNRKSAKVIERNMELQKKPFNRTPGHIAHELCTKDPRFRERCVYTAYVYRNGQLVPVERCAWPCFVRLLRYAWERAGLATARSGRERVTIGEAMRTIGMTS